MAKGRSKAPNITKVNNPVRAPKSSKYVWYVKAKEGNKTRTFGFGDRSYKRNYSDKARKSFRARHKCNESKSKLSKGYWACKLWRKSGLPFS